VRAEAAAARLAAEAKGKSRSKRDLDNVDGDSDADDTDDESAMYAEGARVVRFNNGADKRAGKPETDKKALGLFAEDMPPAIAFRAQPSAGSVFAQEKPFVPMYGPETFSGNTRGEDFDGYLASTRLSPARVPPSLTMVSTPPPVPASSSSNAPRPVPGSSTPTPSRARSGVTFSIQPKKQQEGTPKGPSLADQLAALERTGNSPSPRPSPRPTPPRPGTTIVRNSTPSLFVERKKKKPTPKPGPK
jgi:hypothetical protein